MIITGRDKGKVGSILQISPKDSKVLVEGVAIVTRHRRARKQGEVSKIEKIESYINDSKVMPVCPACQKPTRVGAKVADSGERKRACKRCSEIF